MTRSIGPRRKAGRLQIVTVEHPALRTSAMPIPSGDIGGPELQRLISLMRDTMRSASGVGLAAPQIGEPIELIVIEDRPEYIDRVSDAEKVAERQRYPFPFRALINPQLTILAGPSIDFFEGCLSLPGYLAVVPRSLSVRVEAFDENGERVVLEANGWLARILQHEVDHLNGIMYTDRMDPRTFMSKQLYERYWKDTPVETIRTGVIV